MATSADIGSGSGTPPVSPLLSFSPPQLPARSPLRPPARSISSSVAPSNTSTLTLDSPVSPQTPTDDLPNISDLSLPAHFHMRDRHNSFPSLNGLIDPLIHHLPSDPDLILKSLPDRPQTPLSINLEDDTSASISNSTSSASSVAPSTITMSKRHHAMHELLSSERAYAADLALIKDTHIPLALGQAVPLQKVSTESPTQNSNTSNVNVNVNVNLSSSPPSSFINNGSASTSAFTSISGPRSGSGSGSISISGSTLVPAPSSSRTVSTASSFDSSTSTSTSTSSSSSSSSSTSLSSSENNNNININKLKSKPKPKPKPKPELVAPLAQSMSGEDVKLIFGNIDELAILSNDFSDELQKALGTVIDGGQGEDSIGALFLRKIPEFEQPYKQYITRHPTALQHLQNLPQTPELTAYLALTQRVAAQVSHAWDLASLLIKPVQRLLKYPLLLNAIIDETPDGHPDKDNLRVARQKIEELARNVNEGRRRAEVVKDVLTAKSVKKPNAPVGVSASVNLSKVKSLRHGGVTAATMRVSQLTEGNGEAAQVEAMQAELKKIEVFAQQFARNVVDWGKMMANVMLALRTWGLSFGKVIGLSADQGSEAFDAFMDVIRSKLMPLTADLEAAINERLLKDMAHLLMTMNQPLKLLASMNEQEPYHYHLLTMPVSQKNRPPPALLAASTNYLALRGQLAAELPTYLTLLRKGFTVFVLRLSTIQTRFWKDVKEHWAELWEMLRVESELNVGWEETCHVWHARWADVDEVVRALNIMQPVPHIQPTPRVWYTAPVTAGISMPVTVSMAAGAGAAPPTPSTPAIPASPNPAKAGPSQLDEYFAYPGFYMPMTPLYSSSPKESKKEKEKRESNGKLEKHNSKSSSGHGHGHNQNQNHYDNSPNANTNTKGDNGPAKVATVHSMFAALEPAHSPVVRKNPSKQTLVPGTPSIAGGASRNYGAATSSASLAHQAGYAPVFVAGSLFGVGSGGGSGYTVSAPMPLGSAGGHGRGGAGGMSRGRGPSRSDASTLASGSGSGSSGSGSRRPSSQDSSVQARQLRDGYNNGNGNGNGAGQRAGNVARRRTHGHGMAEEYAEYIAMHGGIPPPYEGQHYPYSGYGMSSSQQQQYRQGLSRMKSMPLSDRSSMLTTGTANTVASSAVLPLSNGGGYVVDGDRVYYREAAAAATTTTSLSAEEEEDMWDEQQYVMDYHYPEMNRYADGGGGGDERGRDRTRAAGGNSRNSGQSQGAPPPVQSSSTKSGSGTSPKRHSKTKEHARKRSGSVKSITSFFSGHSSPNNNNNTTTPPPDPQPLTASQRDSWVSKPAKYVCQVIHPCRPPASVSYYSFPFFTLREGDLFEVLQEAGHPSIHPKLPLYVDDGEDCLLLCRDGNGVVGWALASFLEPLSLSG